MESDNVRCYIKQKKNNLLKLKKKGGKNRRSKVKKSKFYVSHDSLLPAVYLLVFIIES